MDKPEGLELLSVCKCFESGGSPVPVLKDLSWRVRPGDTVAIVGPSGIGKSTLLHILGALDRPDAGALMFQGNDIFSLDDAGLARIRNRHMGFVFQFHHLLPEFTALENVMMPAWIAGIGKREAQDRAKSLLDRVGLSHRLHHRVPQLSGGEQQRAALARALVMEPPFLLADEPTGNLDIENSRNVHELLLKIHAERGCALVVVTHNLELARMMDRQVTLVGGGVATAAGALSLP